MPESVPTVRVSPQVVHTVITVVPQVHTNLLYSLPGHRALCCRNRGAGAAAS